ncbi:MAG: carbon-nitrogen hydrolase family protein [Candidatus Zhuqueibacterota bacterium]
MKIGIAQIDCTLGDVPANLTKIRTFAERAKSAGCDVVVFPELSETGYDMAIVRRVASGFDGAPMAMLRDTAARLGMHVICGLSERSAGVIYNTCAVIDPVGSLIAAYRKVHLADYPPLNEGSCFSPGNSLTTVTIAGLTFGLMICYDLRFPEMSRAHVLSGAQTLVLCSAWPFPRLIHWQTLIAARAIENQCYFIAANRTGTDGPAVFCGSSRIVDPYGIIVTSAAENREELLTADISADVISAVRKAMPIFNHRRPDVYTRPDSVNPSSQR